MRAVRERRDDPCSFALSALPVALVRAIGFRPDLVFVVAPSLVSAPVGWLAAKLCGAKTWLHIQDFEVEAAFATGLLPDHGPVLATAAADTALGAEVQGAGLLVPPGDFIAASQALVILLDDPALRARLGAEARSRALDRWDMAAILRRLGDDFHTLVQKD